MTTCDVLVLGVGGVGSAAMLHLAKRGLQVVGLDRFQPPHSHGSSHGQTRAIRQAYFEHPSYVPMLRRAYSLWDALENESGESLFHRVGLIEAGPVDGAFLRAPYLHNASVLTLAELINLEPRRTEFYRGRNTYDIERVGFHSPSARDDQRYFRFDTAAPGNSNSGHDYPWAIDDPRRDPAALSDLLAYLKTL